jgi:hypothetical protein
MDPEVTEHRSASRPLRRTVWCQLLPLVVFWHTFDGARVELPRAWRINDFSAYVSAVEIAKDVIIFYDEEKEPLMPRIRNDITEFRLINVRPSFSLFSGPNYTYGRSPTVYPAVNYDTLNSVAPITIRAKDCGIGKSITARACGSGRGGPIIPEMAAENSGDSPVYLGVESIGGWTLAIRIMSGQPEAGKKGTDIGAELAMFHVSRSEPLFASENSGGSGSTKSQWNPHRSNPIVQISMLAFGAGCSGIGFWQMFSPKRNQFGPLRVVALLVVGWCLVVLGGIWL